jgi:hypothetical protein
MSYTLLRGQCVIRYPDLPRLMASSRIETPLAFDVWWVS